MTMRAKVNEMAKQAVRALLIDPETRAKLEDAVRDAINDAWGVDGVDSCEELIIDEPGDVIEMIITELDVADPEACPGCGCLPGEGITDGCNHVDGCGSQLAS